MAKLASIASGSFTASTTWGVIEETSFRASTQNFGGKYYSCWVLF